MYVNFSFDVNIGNLNKGYNIYIVIYIYIYKTIKRKNDRKYIFNGIIDVYRITCLLRRTNSINLL